MSETHEPTWYQEGQKRLHQLQRDCWGFHSPELKKHPLCDACTIKLCRQIAVLERDRAASFVDSLGHPELAARIRLLP